MLARVVLVAVLVGVAVVIALVAQRRRPAPPTNPGSHRAPAQLDRDDFDAPGAPWLVVVFSSSTCSTCAAVASSAEVLRSPEVAVCVIEAMEAPALHRRYQIDAVPITVIAGSDGAVVRSFVGPVSATHLWGALAEVREPGSVPPGCGAGEADVPPVDPELPER